MNKEEITLLLEEYNQLAPEAARIKDASEPYGDLAKRLAAAIPLMKLMKNEVRLKSQLSEHQEILLEAQNTLLKLNDVNRPQYPHDTTWLKGHLASVHKTLKKMNFISLEDALIENHADILTACSELRALGYRDEIKEISSYVWQSAQERCTPDFFESLKETRKSVMRYTKRIAEDKLNPDLAILSFSIINAFCR